MNQYVITYFGGDQPETKEEGLKHFAKYQEWLKSLGDAVIKPMVPFSNVRTINPDSTIIENSVVGMSGHTVIQAETIEQAVEYTKDCPFLAINGTLEVAEIIKV